MADYAQPSPDAGYDQMDVPGCIGVIADPGDLICFAALTYTDQNQKE